MGLSLNSLFAHDPDQARWFALDLSEKPVPTFSDQAAGFGRVLRNSIRFLAVPTSMMRLTKMPGVWMWSGSISRAGTRCSTSATVTFAAVAIIGLKFRAALR